MHFTALFFSLIVTGGLFYAMGRNQWRTHVVIPTPEQTVVAWGLVVCFVWAFYIAFSHFL